MSLLTRRLAQFSQELRVHLQERIGGKGDQVILSVSRDTTAFPLSFAQQRLWFLEQLEPGNAASTLVTAVTLEGSLCVELLEQSCTCVLARHESLRTIFPFREGQSVQEILPPAPFALDLLDLSSLPAEERTPASERAVQRAARKPFSLEKGPLLRALLCRLGEQEHILMLSMHQIIADGWSMGVLMQEIAACYDSLLRGQSPALPELPVQYVDYTLWQRGRLQDEIWRTHLEYWRPRLSDAPILDLPTDHPRPAQRSSRGALYTFALPVALTDSLRQLSRREQTTLTLTLLTALGILLARYSGQQEVVVGMPIAHRTHAEVERLIGLFMNTLALRLDLTGEPSFLQLLQRVGETCLEAEVYQDLPFEKLVEELQPPRSLSHSPFFQVMFIPQQQPAAPLDFPGLRIRTLHPDRQAAMFDLSLSIFEQEREIEVCAEYSTDLFTEATIARMMRHYLHLLESSVAEPQTSIWRLPLLDADELRRQLRDWNATRRVFASRRCVHECVEVQAESCPDALALICGGQSLSYRDLELRSNQLARALQKRGVGPGCLVGILLERSPEMVVGMLAILKAGGAYVPLDSEYPGERLSSFVQESGLRVLLTQEGLLERIGEQPGVEIVNLERERCALAQESSARPISDVGERDLACVIYTSDSTGGPRGVQISHAAIVNLLCSLRERPGLSADDILLAVTSISSGRAGLEIFLSLTTGARLVLLDRESARDGRVLARRIVESGATLMQATPATWRLLLETGWQGKLDLKILCAGEALVRSLANQLITKGASVWNLYGATEATTWSTVARVTAGEGPVSIGRPIANTQISILDASRAPVPPGVIGDIYIAGAGLARGYLKCPGLSAERFIADPFSVETQARMYKTGDRGAYRADGSILCLGPSDHQIELRGFRIELSEIESVLTGHPAVQAAAVLAHEDTPGHPRLVAYVLSRQADQIECAGPRAWLKQHLPDYMIPSAFVVLAAFPLTPDGKLDRRALPVPAGTFPVQEFEAPRNEIEAIIAADWRQLLGLSEVGIHQNFFALGGHSLIVSQAIARLNTIFRVEFPLRVFFTAPTIAELAQLVASARAGQDLATVERAAEVTLTEEIRRTRSDIQKYTI